MQHIGFKVEFFIEHFWVVAALKGYSSNPDSYELTYSKYINVDQFKFVHLWRGSHTGNMYIEFNDLKYKGIGYVCDCEDTLALLRFANTKDIEKIINFI